MPPEKGGGAVNSLSLSRSSCVRVTIEPGELVRRLVRDDMILLPLSVALACSDNNGFRQLHHCEPTFLSNKIEHTADHFVHFGRLVLSVRPSLSVESAPV